jgi:hypothetical protein
MFASRDIQDLIDKGALKKAPPAAAAPTTS